MNKKNRIDDRRSTGNNNDNNNDVYYDDENKPKSVHIEIDEIVFDDGFDYNLDRNSIANAIELNLSHLLSNQIDVINFGNTDTNIKHGNKANYLKEISSIDGGSFKVGTNELASRHIGEKISSSIFKALTKINR